VRFRLSLSKRNEQAQAAVAAFVDAPADLVPGTYEGRLKTWECALDSRGVPRSGRPWWSTRRRVRGSRVLEVRSCSSDGFFCYRG
jgi:hypothetical protein